MEAGPSIMDLYRFVLVCVDLHRFILMCIDSYRLMLIYNEKHKLLSVTICFACFSTLLICLVSFYGSIWPGDAGWPGGSVCRSGRVGE